jgi:hypothetical protein
VISPYLKLNPLKDLPADSEHLYGVSGDIPTDVHIEVVRAGLWWVHPLGRRSPNVIVGLRLTPGVPLARSPVVSGRNATVSTESSSPAYLIPLHLHQYLIGGEEGWDRVASFAASKEKWAALLKIHHVLGGQDNLEHIRKMLADRALRKVYADESNLRARRRAIGESRQKIEPVSETLAYLQYASKAADTFVAPLPTPDAGCWNAALASLVFYASQNDPDEEPRLLEELDSAWRVMHFPPGLDTSRSGTGTALISSSEKSSALVKSAAKIVVKRKQKEWVSDPLFPAIEKLAKTKKYDGAAHVVAAAELERAGRFADAFNALIAAAYWEQNATGVAGKDRLEAALKLAKKAKWEEIAGSLEQQRETRRWLEEEEGL